MDLLSDDQCSGCEDGASSQGVMPSAPHSSPDRPPPMVTCPFHHCCHLASFGSAAHPQAWLDLHDHMRATHRGEGHLLPCHDAACVGLTKCSRCNSLFSFRPTTDANKRSPMTTHNANCKSGYSATMEKQLVASIPAGSAAAAFPSPADFAPLRGTRRRRKKATPQGGTAPARGPSGIATAKPTKAPSSASPTTTDAIDLTASDWKWLDRLSISDLVALDVVVLEPPRGHASAEHGELLARGLNFAAAHASTPHAVLGLKHTAVANLATCAFPRGCERPDSATLSRRITKALRGDLRALWEELAQSASADPAPPPPHNSPDASPASGSDLEDLSEGPLAAKRRLGRLLSIAGAGHLAKAWRACSTSNDDFADLTDPEVLATLAALHPQTPTPRPLKLPADVARFVTPPEEIRWPRPARQREILFVK